MMEHDSNSGPDWLDWTLLVIGIAMVATVTVFYFRTAASLKEERRLASELAELQPQLKSARDLEHLRDDVARFNRELSGWKSSRLEVGGILQKVLVKKPAGINLTRISIQGQWRESQRTPDLGYHPRIREFRLTVGGEATGVNRDVIAADYIAGLEATNSIGGTFHGIRYGGLAVNPSRDASAPPPVFAIEGIASPRPVDLPSSP
jgi:hypothetical protein